MMNPPSISKIWFYKGTQAKFQENLATPMIQQKIPDSQDKIMGGVPKSSRNFSKSSGSGDRKFMFFWVSG
jgi:hypothetical protein